MVTLDGDTSIRFVGYATSPIVATYAFVTLRRQMERDAARHLFQIRIASTRRRRRETYGYGWVSGLASHFTPDTLSPSDHKLFAHHSGFAEHLTCVSHDPTAHLNELSETNIRDYFYGMQGGTRARYRPGVNTHRRAHHAAMAFESNRYV
ncbi:MAG: hypothetical protein ABIW82_16910 [Dokdonella sp.]